MNIGSTVWYRLSDKDADLVETRRADGEKFRKELRTAVDYIQRRSSGTHIYQELTPLLFSGFQVHTGSTVSSGELLPATVVVLYNAAEMLCDSYGPFDFDKRPENPEGVFSGFADIRVLLPGNDVLWVPGTCEDVNCEGVQTPNGLLSLPAPGKFTSCVPPGLT